ncbi:putative Ig domain-containing protein [Azospirillum sp. sgz302134]
MSFGIQGGTGQGNVVTKAGAYGTLTVNTATGAFTFTPDSAAIDALSGGARPQDAFTVTAADGKGGTATQALTITLVGADEAPTVTTQPATTTTTPTPTPTTTTTTTPTPTPAATPVVEPAVTVAPVVAPVVTPPAPAPVEPAPAASTVTAPAATTTTTPVLLSAVETAKSPTAVASAAEPAPTPISQAVFALAPSAPSYAVPAAYTTTADTAARSTTATVAPQAAASRDAATAPSASPALAPSASFRGVGTLPPQVTVVSGADDGSTASLITVGSVGDRVVTPGEPNLISVPAGTFQTSNPNARISLQATLSDGSPLPAWLKFDTANGTFNGNPPSEMKATFNIKVIARDDQGAQATTEFRVNIGNNASDKAAAEPAPRPANGANAPADNRAPANDAPANDAPANDGAPAPEAQPDVPGRRAGLEPEPAKAPVGKLAFSRQVGASAPSGLLAESEALLRNIQMLLAG